MPSCGQTVAEARARRLIPAKPRAADRRHRVRDPARQPLLRLAVQAVRQAAAATLLAQADRGPGDPQPPVPLGARQPRPEPGLAAVQADGAGRLRPLPGGHAAGRRRLRRRAQPRPGPRAAGRPLDGLPAEPAEHGPEVAEDEVPAADGAAVPPQAAAVQAPPGLRPAVADRERVLAEQAAAGLGVAGPQVGRTRRRRS